MTGSQIVQIRKKGGLQKILKNKNGSTINPMLFKSSSRNPNEEGIPEGDYRGKTILDTRHFISPTWFDIKNQWSWSGTSEDLTRLIKGMKLRYPKTDPKEGQLIEPGNVLDRLVNQKDDVFNHPDLYGKFFMENGRISLNLSDPKQEFLLMCYKGDYSKTEDKSSDKPISKYVSAGTKYEIVSPKKEHIRAKKDADKEIKAITLLAAMNNDDSRMRSIAKIMSLPQYSDATDISGIFVLLKDVAAQNPKMSSKYNKSYQDRFIELAEMSDEDLNINAQVMDAKSRGFLRRRQGFYLFNGNRIEGIDTDARLVNYFRNPENQEKYLELLDLLNG